MAVDLVIRGVEEGALVLGLAGVDLFGTHRPDAVALVAAGVHVARIFNGHLRIGGMQAAYVLVVQAALALDEDLPEGPVVGVLAHWSKGWRLLVAGRRGDFRQEAAMLLFFVLVFWRRPVRPHAPRPRRRVPCCARPIVPCCRGRCP